MSKFQITENQERILQAAASEERIATGPGSGYCYNDLICQSMVTRGWLARAPRLAWQTRRKQRAYRITEIGRAVERQLRQIASQAQEAGGA